MCLFGDVGLGVGGFGGVVELRLQLQLPLQSVDYELLQFGVSIVAYDVAQEDD